MSNNIDGRVCFSIHDRGNKLITDNYFNGIVNIYDVVMVNTGDGGFEQLFSVDIRVVDVGSWHISK